MGIWIASVQQLKGALQSYEGALIIASQTNVHPEELRRPPPNATPG
ncbi:hypothetical protein GCM10027176_41800 [Actinoallomurus bryophytorum]|uniref:Uncharacterized protein n=1 Tax=Actinoallomurus bryophytorum TaxID=1490222 RepID=A0A543CDX4_9ACTN|nr:hypothetical protein [Actinoallomurus bryophytorum]TQL95200.1 hypothetical protein FB559_0698 [Actinoallomurus bryophytorum]